MRHLLFVFCLMIFCINPARAAEPAPGDSCSPNGTVISSAEDGSGHFMTCEQGTWKSIYSYNAAGNFTRLGNQACTSGQVLKFNGTLWACAADEAGMAGGGLGGAQMFAASGTFTVPPNVTRVKASLIGGGGGASGSGYMTGGQGGGGGALVIGYVDVTPGSAMPVIVGTGGPGGSGSNKPGTDGSSSSFGGLSANGGGKGLTTGAGSGLGGIASGGSARFNGEAGGAAGGGAIQIFSGKTYGYGGNPTSGAGQAGMVLIEW